VPWILLEPCGSPLVEKVLKHFRQFGKLRDEEYDRDRITFPFEFGPDKIYLGRTGWEGYVVFCFEAKGRAVLECPKYGNAIYLMQTRDWESLSKLSKTELRLEHRREVSRIIHINEWQYELGLWIESGWMPLFE
jgi:hypothetical protein